MGLILDYLQPQRSIKLLIITLGATAAGMWLVWPVAMRQFGLKLYQFIAYPALYVVWLSLFLLLASAIFLTWRIADAPEF